MSKRRGEAPADDEALGETQRKILTAALEIFSERGFSGSSTAAIAERAGVAEKTLFAQFKSKAALLARTLRPSVFLLIEPRVFDRVRESLDPGASRTLSDVVGALMRDRLDLASKHPKKLKLIAHELLLRPELLTFIGGEFEQRVIPIVTAAFRELEARGELRSDVPHRTILRTFISVTVGLALSRHVLGLEGDVDDDAEVEHIVSILVDGLRPR